jgi:hypothetical protein
VAESTPRCDAVRRAPSLTPQLATATRGALPLRHRPARRRACVTSRARRAVWSPLPPWHPHRLVAQNACCHPCNLASLRERGPSAAFAWMRARPARAGPRPPWSRTRRPPARDRLPPRSCIDGKAAALPSLSRSMQLRRPGGHLPHPRCAPPFVHASERRRVQASDARAGRRAGASADADVASADRAQCGSEVAETRALARPQLRVGRSAAFARSRSSCWRRLTNQAFPVVL